MKPPIRAALINAFLFPGLGHFHLKRVARGCIFLVPTLLAALVFVNGVIDLARPIAEQIVAGTLPPDPFAIMAKVKSAAANTPLLAASGYLLVGCWAASIADALWMRTR